MSLVVRSVAVLFGAVFFAVVAIPVELVSNVSRCSTEALFASSA